MSKTKKFIVNIWVNGYVDGKEIFGRTCIMNDMEMVAFVNSDAVPSIIEFNKLENTTKITSVDSHPKQNEIQQKVESSSITKLLARKTLYKHISN